MTRSRCCSNLSSSTRAGAGLLWLTAGRREEGMCLGRAAYTLLFGRRGILQPLVCGSLTSALNTGRNGGAHSSCSTQRERQGCPPTGDPGQCACSIDILSSQGLPTRPKEALVKSRATSPRFVFTAAETDTLLLPERLSSPWGGHRLSKQHYHPQSHLLNLAWQRD